MLLCDANEISELNRKYLGRAGPTDVLSFAQDAVPREGKATGQGAALLGDVVICPEVALRQGEKRGVSVEVETLDLLAHGILHLLGYRDDTSAMRRRMLKRQKELVEEFRRREGTRGGNG